MKKLLTLLSIATLALISACDNGHGSNVKHEMQQMSLAMNKLTSASTPEEFQQAATILREVSVQAMEKQPASIDNPEDFKGYQAGMKQFIDAIDQANTLATEGKLDEAKRAMQPLFELKSQYHSKYK